MEELKMILATVEQLGETGSWMFYAYMGISLLKFLVATCALFIISKLLIMVLQGQNPNENTLKELRTILGAGSSGYLSHEERVRIIEKVMELKHERSNNG